MTHRIIIDENGFLRCIYNPKVPLEELGAIKLRRLSHITLAFAPIKGPLFRLLRLLFGERGRVADWTRQWRCMWKVKVIACGEWSVFFDRADAVKWELKHLAECEVCNGTFVH